MRPAAAARVSWAASVALDFCFEFTRPPPCSCKFSSGNLDAELLPFSKVGGELLWSCFCLPGRSATRRLQFFSPECEAAKRSIFALRLFLITRTQRQRRRAKHMVSTRYRNQTHALS